MVTNYYLYQKADSECCGRSYDPLHIGKSSGGWCFAMHVMPEDNINTLDDWRNLWATPGAYIRNEYRELVSIANMELTIAERSREKDWDSPKWWQDHYRSEEDFHAKNHSERGPSGLLRHAIGAYCKGHGDGTWDYMVGEFC